MATTSDDSLFWFVIGYFIAQLGNVLLLVKINKQKSVYGVSMDSQITLLIATLSRCIWFSDTKLPTMWIAICEITIAVCLHLYIVYQCYKYKDALQQEMPIFLRYFVLLAIALVLSCFFHPGKKGDYFFTQQMFVSFTMFCEALSLVSQLYHMRMSKGVDGLNAKYLAALAISRVSRIYFWYTMSNKMSTFWYLIAADSVHTIMVVSFAVLYRMTQKNYSDVFGFSEKRESRAD